MRAARLARTLAPPSPSARLARLTPAPYAPLFSAARALSTTSVSAPYAPLAAQYAREGYAVAREVLDPQLLGEMGEHVAWLQRRYPGIPTEHLHHQIMRGDAFWCRVVSDPRLLDLAAAFSPFLADGIAVFSSHYFAKPPRSGMRVLMHQDGSYWPLRPMDVCTLWIAVTPSNRSNGCLQVIAGTHTEGLAELKQDRSVRNVLGSATHTDEDIARAGWASRIVNLELAAGDVSIHHPSIIHGSDANTSAHPRIGLTVRYISTRTQCLDPEQPVLLVRGAAVPGINSYRSWARYRPGHDMPFSGAAAWNDKRRTVPEDESFFSRTDYAAQIAEVRAGLEAFVDKLGGR